MTSLRSSSRGALATLSLLLLSLMFSEKSLVAQAQDDPTDDGGEPLDPDMCRPMQQIYKNGSHLCETIFGDAFRYVPAGHPDYDLAYTMWYFSRHNPNDNTTLSRINRGLHPDPDYQSTDVCWLKTDGTTVHKANPDPESEATFTECFPFRENSCCEETTVENSTVINSLYGPEYRWDRCGRLSPECERFFVQEACFYECDPNVGLFRKYTPKDVQRDPALADEAWAITQMPIKGDYCDAWFQACREELFCGTGDFFSCSKIHAEDDDTAAAGSSGLTPGAIAGIVIASIVLAAALVFLGVLIHNERRGHPVFQKISNDDSKPLSKPGTTSAPAAGAFQRNDEITTI